MFVHSIMLLSIAIVKHILPDYSDVDLILNMSQYHAIVYLKGRQSTTIRGEWVTARNMDCMDLYDCDIDSETPHCAGLVILQWIIFFHPLIVGLIGQNAFPYSTL